MSAESLPLFRDAEPPAESPQLRLFDRDSAENGVREPRIVNPVLGPLRGPQADLVDSPPTAPTAEMLAAYGDVSAHYAPTKPRVNEFERQSVQMLPLNAFYAAWMAAWRDREVSAGRCSPATREKELQALRRYDDWDRANDRQPASWPRGIAWTGLPIAYLTGPRIEDFLRDLSSRLARATVKSTWNHLRTVLNFAVEIQAIDTAPAPRQVDFSEVDEDDDLFARTFSLDECGTIYERLDGNEQLQSAFVVAVSTGLRSVDLLGLRWRNVRTSGDQAQRPQLRVKAQKTGKLQSIPLAGCVVAHVDRLRASLLTVADDAWVFDRLVSHNHQQPTKSRAARRSLAELKAAIEAAGVDVPDKPWQVCRATCNTRLEMHRPGVGKWVLGHSANDVNATSYTNPTEDIYEAINTLPQPPQFLRL